MKYTDEFGPGVQALDERLHRAAVPEEEAVARVRDAVLGRMHEAASSPQPGSRWGWMAPAAAAAVLLVVAGVFVARDLVARPATGGSSAAFGTGASGTAGSGTAASGTAGSGTATSATTVAPGASTVVAPGAAGGGPVTGAPAPGGVPPGGFGSGGASLAARPETADGRAASFAPIGYYGCGAAPTVQLQNRGVAATGVAMVASPAGKVTYLNFSLLEQDADPAAALSRVHKKMESLQSALTGAGVAATEITVGGLNVYSYKPAPNTSNLTTASGSVQARISNPDLVARATAAGLAVPGIQSFNSTTGGASADLPSEAVQKAVADATSQARAMAAATARAADLTLTDVQSIVSQPPTGCYGAAGFGYMIQVTVTYNVK